MRPSPCSPGQDHARAGRRRSAAGQHLDVDETKLDDLLNRIDAVRELFAFEMSSSSPDVVLLGFDRDTRYSASGYQLNVAYAGGAITSANLGGAADGSDGSISVNGNA